MKVCLLILLLDVSACFSAKSVADFSFVTWNADGGQHWDAVKHYFLKSNVDLMAIQAAAELPYYPSLDAQTVFRAVPEGDSVPNKFLGATATKPAIEIEEYLWNLTDHDQLYLYYYGGRNGPPKEAPHSDPPPSGTQNLAILSRHKAHKLFLLPMVDSKGESVEPTDEGTHSPLMGLRIESALFLNFHSEDRDDTATKSTAVVNRITNITATHYPTLTWVLMGDFDQTPANLAEALAHLPGPPADIFRRVVATGAATRVPQPWDKQKSRPAVASSGKVFGRRNRRNRKHRQHRGHCPVVVPRTLPQLNANDKTQLPITAMPVETTPFRMVQRKHRKHHQRVPFCQQASRNSKAAASCEVDYAVFGGPFSSRHIMKLVNVELLKNYFARVKITRYPRNPSHHLPLIFNKQL